MTIVKSFKARLNPPIYTIIEIGTPRTKNDLRNINEELARAGSDARVTFEKGDFGRYRVSAFGQACLRIPARELIPLTRSYLVIGPDKNIIQTNHLGNFTII